MLLLLRTLCRVKDFASKMADIQPSLTKYQIITSKESRKEFHFHSIGPKHYH